MSTADGFAVPDLLWSVEALAARLGTPGLCVLDVRASALFAAGHVPGALSFDLYAINCFDTDPARSPRLCGCTPISWASAGSVSPTRS